MPAVDWGGDALHLILGHLTDLQLVGLFSVSKAFGGAALAACKSPPRLVLTMYPEPREHWPASGCQQASPDRLLTLMRWVRQHRLNYCIEVMEMTLHQRDSTDSDGCLTQHYSWRPTVERGQHCPYWQASCLQPAWSAWFSAFTSQQQQEFMDLVTAAHFRGHSIACLTTADSLWLPLAGQLRHLTIDTAPEALPLGSVLASCTCLQSLSIVNISSRMNWSLSPAAEAVCNYLSALKLTCSKSAVCHLDSNLRRCLRAMSSLQTLTTLHSSDLAAQVLVALHTSTVCQLVRVYMPCATLTDSTMDVLLAGPKLQSVVVSNLCLQDSHMHQPHGLQQLTLLTSRLTVHQLSCMPWACLGVPLRWAGGDTLTLDRVYAWHEAKQLSEVAAALALGPGIDVGGRKLVLPMQAPFDHNQGSITPAWFRALQQLLASVHNCMELHVDMLMLEPTVIIGQRGHVSPVGMEHLRAVVQCVPPSTPTLVLTTVVSGCDQLLGLREAVSSKCPHVTRFEVLLKRHHTASVQAAEDWNNLTCNACSGLCMGVALEISAGVNNAVVAG